MAEASVFVIRDRRESQALLTRFGSRRRRIITALLVAAGGGWQFAAVTHSGVVYYPNPPVLEYDPGTVYISRYLGKPLEEEQMEADPADAASQPNLDRFYRVVANRVKVAVGDRRTTYSVWICGLGACHGAAGWPFESRVVSYRVSGYEIERFDGRAPGGISMRVGEDGLDPNRPWGWWANAAVGSAATGVAFFGLLTLVVMLVRRSQQPAAGFPVIVRASPSGGAEAIADCVIPQD